MVLSHDSSYVIVSCHIILCSTEFIFGHNIFCWIWMHLSVKSVVTVSLFGVVWGDLNTKTNNFHPTQDSSCQHSYWKLYKQTLYFNDWINKRFTLPPFYPNTVFPLRTACLFSHGTNKQFWLRITTSLILWILQLWIWINSPKGHSAPLKFSCYRGTVAFVTDNKSNIWESRSAVEVVGFRQRNAAVITVTAYDIDDSRVAAAAKQSKMRVFFFVLVFCCGQWACFHPHNGTRWGEEVVVSHFFQTSLWFTTTAPTLLQQRGLSAREEDATRTAGELANVGWRATATQRPAKRSLAEMTH